MSNARIQFSTASEEKWLQVNPVLREGELVIARKANGKRKLVLGKAGGSAYSDSEVVWDEELAASFATRAENAAAAAENQSTSCLLYTSPAGAASNANTAASNAAGSASSAAVSESNAKKYMEKAKEIASFYISVTDDGDGNVNMKF